MNKKKIVSYVIDGILIGLILLLAYVQISMTVSRGKNHNVPTVFGKSFLYFATESMNDPENPDCLKAGTGIIIEKVKDFDSLRVSKPIYGNEEKPDEPTDYEKDGDIVTFYLESKKIPDTHRLIYKDYNPTTGVYTFRTMGDNPDAHKTQTYEEWTGDLLIGRVVYHSAGLGTFLSFASPEAAASAGKKAWFFPVAIITPIVVLAIYYVADAFIKYSKEEKAFQAQVDEAMKQAGIDMNDEEAVELFRMKEEIRLEYQQEKEKMKKKIRKELEKKQNER